MKKFFQGKIKFLIMIAFLFLFFFNTVAYSGLASKLAITSEAMFRASADIRVTGIKLESASNGAVENYSPKYNVDNTTTGFTLPNANSSITYRVTVTNYGDRNQTIYSFIKQSINKDGINVTVTGYKEKDIIKFNTSVEFLITITATTPDTNPINLIEQYEFRKVYTVEYQNTDGTQVLEPQYKYEKESLKLREDVLTKTDYDFKGWTCSLGDYAAGSEYTLDQDIILYPKFEKKKGKLDLNYNIDGTWYYSGYNNKIQTGIKVAGSDKGYLNDFGGTYEYGTSYEIYGFKIDGVEIPYSKKYTVDGNNYLNISFNTINFTVNNANLGSITPTQLIVIPGTTFTVSSNVITLSDGRIATASTKDVTGYKTKFSSYTITPNSTTINAKTTAQANFTKEAEKYTITLDNKSATTAGTTAIYEKYNTGIYLDSALTKAMTTSTNAITKPSKTGYTFKGYYTKENGQGDQIINENGYITDKITSTTYTANTTLYAYYKDDIKPTLTLTNSSNGNWTNKDVTITLNGADSGSGIKEYQLKYSGSSNVWKKTTAPKDTWGAERNETVYYRAVDNAGNESDAVSTSIRIDKTTPKIELNGAASSSEINNSNNVTIPIKITETASGINNSEFTASDISVLINGTTVNPSTKTLTYNSVSNGVYSYTLTLSGITLNGKVTLEIVAGAVKDIATNSNVKTTLDPSITVNNTYTISLNGNGATTAGTTAIYEKYNTGIYLDSALSNAMSTNANAITKPTRSYTVSFNANNTGITVPSAITGNYSYSGHYTDATNGTQMINENGYITSSFKNTSYTANGTLYAHWGTKPSVTIPAISKTGYTCTWNTSSDGNGTTYNAGDVTDKLNTQTLYAVCKANSYTVSYNSNGGSGTMTNDTATYNSNFITKKNTFTKTGYTFNGWNEKADGTGTVWGLTTSGVYESGKTWKWTYAKNITLYAQWKANTNTKYVVKHYKQKLDGTYPSEADDTDNLTGTTGASVSPAVKDVKNNSNYIGFTAPSVQTVTIAADGSTLVTYKYTRNKYTFTLGSAAGVSTSGSTASGSYYYGSTITLKATASSGYTWSKWTSSNTSLVGNQTTANTTFTMPAGNITMTPSVTVNSYTVTYDATTNGGSTAKQTASTKYKSLVDLTKKAEKSGYEFVGWNTNKDATSALSSYEMPAKDVTLYAIYSKTLRATFNYYNSKSETKSVTIYNNATSGSITSPAALGTPSGYTFRHYSTSNAANASKTIDANSAVALTSNQTYYASYQKTVTLNFYYHSGTDTYANTQTSTTATGVQYLGYNNAIVNSTVSIPSAVTGSTGYYGTTYKGVLTVNSTTPISVNTGTTNYYAYYQVGITYYYYNGSAHTTGTGTRTAYSNGTNYVTSVNITPTPSAYDGASFKGWSYTNDSVNDRNPAYTAMTALYAYYQKTVTATFNYYDGSKAASATAGNTRTYISKSGGVNTINTNITIPDVAKANRGSYTYRGVSTVNTANASVVTPTTANTTYYSSYTYAITATFKANGGTGTAPSAVAGTGYMNYSGTKIGISVTMPSNTFARNGYTFGGWNDTVANKTYTAGTSTTIDSSRDFNATWNVVTYTIKYNLNGGTVSTANPTSYKITDADITLNNPTKPGYTFTGWTGTGLSEASTTVTIKSGSYGNREYTANYSINQYYYDVNPDSGIKSFDITIGGKTSTGLTDYYQKQNYGTEATITNVVAKTGYTYTGYTLGGSMSTLTGSTNANIKTKLGAGNGAIGLISKANALTFEAQTLASIKYSTTPQALVFKGASNGTGSYSYAITAGNTNSYFTINGTTITTSDTAVPPVGTYKLTVQATDNTSKVTATAEITIVIEKASSTNPTLTAYSGTYDGQPHTIGVTGGSGGTIQYSTDNKTWSTTKPTRTAQGTTTVYVKVVGDSNHTDTSAISSTITIKPATITYTASSYEGFYDGNGHTISVSVTKPTSGATITYSTSANGTYSATKPSYTAAGTYTIYFKIEAANYTTITDNRTVKINTTSLSGSVTITGTNTWGQTLTANVTNTNSATLSYQWYSTTSTTATGGTAIADATENTYKIDKSLVGKYIYVVVTASKTNYNKATWSDITDTTNKTATVAKQALSVTANAATTTYDGKEHNATVKVNSALWDGKTIVSGTSTSYGSTVTSAGVTGTTYNLLPSRTAKGTTSISYKITGGSYYNDFTGTSSVAINPAGLSGSVKITGTNTWGNTLTASVTNTNSATLSYQWYSTTSTTATGGTAISGATKNTYEIDKSLVGKYIYVVVTASKANYNSTTWNDITDTATNGSASVGKKSATISFASSSVTINYGESAKNTLTNTGDGTVSYTSSNTNVATINSTTGEVTIKQAGTTTITAKVTDGTYYTYSTKTISYTLTVKKITNPAKVSPVTGIIYGETKAMVSVTGVQGTIYYSTETELTEANYLSKGSQDIPSSSGRDAETYNIYYYVTGNSNYNAASNTSSTPVKTTISPKSIAVTWGTTTSFTYNGGAQAPSASATTGVTGETMAVTRTTGTNAGSYTSTASCSSVTGGRAKCSNYTLTGNTKAFSIERASMTAPSSPSDKNYTGKEQVSGITCPTGSTAGGMQKATNAGTYKQTCTPDGNHKWSDNTGTGIKEITWKIRTVPATLTCSDKTYNGVGQTACSCSGGTLGGTSSATDAGTYTASCTPDGNHTAPDNKSWKMNAKPVAVTWGTTTSFTYNGGAQAPSASATTGVTGETMAVTRTTGTNAGSYTSTASCSSVTGGRAKCSNYTLTGNTKAFSIERASMTAPSSPSDKNYTGKEQVSGITCPTGSTAGGMQKATNAGTYKQTCTPDGNHKWSDNTGTGIKEITWKIRTVPATLTCSDKTYNGVGQTACSCSGGTLGGTSSATDAGTYTASCTPDGNHTAPDNKSWKMNAKPVAVTWGTTTIFTYNGKAQGPSASISTGISTESIILGITAETNAGSYTSTASCGGVNTVLGISGKCSNYTLTGNTKAFSIERASMTAPSSPSDKNYTGKEQVSGITCPTGSTAGGMQKATNAGTYKQTCTPDGNHKWSDNTGTGIKEITWKIRTVPATLTCSDKTYNGVGQTACSCSGGTLGGTSSATDAGTYTASCTPDGNHTAPDNKSWKMNAKPVAVTWGTTTIFTYNGKAQGPSASISTGISTESIILGITAETNAGSYTSTASCGGVNTVLGISGKCSNYTLTGNTKAFSIERASMTAPSSPSDKNYTGKEQVSGITCPTGSTAGGMQKATNAGTYKQTCTPDGNHKWSDNTGTGIKEITWTINPKSVAVTWGTTTLFTYNGGAQAPSVSATTGVTGETMTVTRTTGKNAGSYTSTASCSSVAGGQKLCSNYSLTGTTKAYTINKQKVSPPTNLNVTTAGIVTWTGVSNATSYQISMDNTNWTAATSGIDYLSSIISFTGTRTIYLRGINSDTTNYETGASANKSISVYTVTAKSGNETMGTVSPTSYKVISGATYSVNSNQLLLKGITSGTTTKTLSTITASPKSGYKFGSWSSTSGTISSDTTITASFDYNSYTVTFNGNGGTVSSSSKTVTYLSQYGTLPKATRANNGNIKYTFEGWYTAATGGEKEKVTKIESTTTYNTAGNQTLYAHWLSSPIIKGGTSEVWSGSSIEILLDTPSKSDTSDTIKYQYYLSTSQTEQVGGTWIDVTSVDGGVAIYENGKHYIFYRAINVNRDISSVSNYNTLLIDSVTPSVTLSAYHRGNGQKIESDQWTNAGLRFEFGDLTAGPSGATIYYCISDSTSCIPSKVASPNQAVTDSALDNKTGVYKFIYQVSSNAGVDSKIFTFIAKVDTTAPTMKGVITSLKDSSTLATLTNSSTSYVDSTWRNYGYTIDLSGTTDGESGIAKIEKYTNANNLSRSDTDYKSNLFSGDITSTKTYTEKANGAKYAKYVATDNAGNKATFIVEVLIDTEGPTMKGVVTSLKDSSTLATLTNSSTSYVDSSWKNYGYKITLSGTDSLSGISKITKYTNANNLKKTDSNYKSNLVSGDITSTKTHSESAAGAKYAKFVATDKAGNTTTFTVEVLIDTVAPNPVIKLYKANSDEKKTGSVLKTIDTSVNTAINSWTNYRHYFDLSSSTDSLSGIKEMKMQINDYGIFATGNTAAGTTDLVTTYDFSTNKYIVVGHSGNRYIRFTIRDKAGNSVVRNIRVYIDLEDPVLSSPKIADRFSSSTTLTYSCEDAMSGFQPFGKSDPKAVEIVFTELKIKSSSSPVTIQCKDTAGNTSTSKTYRWGANSVCGKNSSGGNKTCWHQ